MKGHINVKLYILWTDEAHYHLQNAVNRQNCQILETKKFKHFSTFISSFPKNYCVVRVYSRVCRWSYFFEEVTPAGLLPALSMATAMNFCCPVTSLQHSSSVQCLSNTVFMQESATPHIGTQVKDLLRRTLGNDRVISQNFPTA